MAWIRIEPNSPVRRTFRLISASSRAVHQDAGTILLSILAGAALLGAGFGWAHPWVRAHLDWYFAAIPAVVVFMVLFNGAVVVCALKRFEGREASIFAGLFEAAARAPALIWATLRYSLRTDRPDAMLLFPALLREGLGPADAFARSRQLLKERFGRQWERYRRVDESTRRRVYVASKMEGGSQFLIFTAFGIAGAIEMAGALASVFVGRKPVWETMEVEMVMGLFFGLPCAAALVVGLYVASLNLVYLTAVYLHAAKPGGSEGEVPRYFDKRDLDLPLELDTQSEPLF
jgi:hypothetical protein